MIKGIIFDFDGTMVDTERVVYNAVKKYVAENDQMDYPEAEYRRSVGTTGGVFFENLAAFLGHEVDQTEVRSAIDLARIEQYPTLSLRPQVAKAMAYAKEHQLRLAVVSNSRKAELAHYFDHQLPVAERFDTIITRDDVLNGKPDAEGYQKALAQLGFLPEEVAAFEDSPTGAQAAVTAGVRLFVYANEFTKGMTFPENGRIITEATVVADELTGC